jgi:hypothetical protein
MSTSRTRELMACCWRRRIGRDRGCSLENGKGALHISLLLEKLGQPRRRSHYVRAPAFGQHLDRFAVDVSCTLRVAGNDEDMAQGDVCAAAVLRVDEVDELDCSGPGAGRVFVAPGERQSAHFFERETTATAVVLAVQGRKPLRLPALRCGERRVPSPRRDLQAGRRGYISGLRVSGIRSRPSRRHDAPTMLPRCPSVPAAVARRHDAVFWAVALAFLIVTALATPRRALQLASPDGSHATDERDSRATPALRRDDLLVGLIHEYQPAARPGLRTLRRRLGGVTVRGWPRAMASPPIGMRPS